jgi:hypothetical protein
MRGTTPFASSCPTGTCRGYRAWDAPTRAADGRVTRLTGLDLDVTARRRAEEALQARRDEERDRERTVELERRTAQLSRLASDLTLAEQHAREQLAKTLHDGLPAVARQRGVEPRSTHARGRRSGVPTNRCVRRKVISTRRSLPRDR